MCTCDGCNHFPHDPILTGVIISALEVFCRSGPIAHGAPLIIFTFGTGNALSWDSYGVLSISSGEEGVASQRYFPAPLQGAENVEHCTGGDLPWIEIRVPPLRGPALEKRLFSYTPRTRILLTVCFSPWFLWKLLAPQQRTVARHVHI